MKPYSNDLREKIIEALETGELTQPEVAENFGVSLSFVEKLWQRWRETGSFATKEWTPGPKRSLKDDHELIRAEVAGQPDLTLKELCERVEKAGGSSSSPSMMCRELKRLRLPLKKSRSTPQSEIRPELRKKEKVTGRI
jgi:transposase